MTRERAHADHHPKPEAAAPQPAETPEAPQPQSADELKRLQQDAQQAKEQYLRLLADVENTRKRLQREKEEFARYAAESIVRQLLPIVDSLDQALVAVDPSTRPSASSGLARDPAPRTTEQEGGVSVGLHKPVGVQAVMKGVELIRQQLLGVLAKEGVKRIPTVGSVFDPHRHEAVAHVEANDGQADDVITEEVQVGYTMHDKVIRPAMVKVAKAKSQKSEVGSQKSDVGEKP